MPELPEVETIRRDLLERVAEKRITAVEICHTKACQGNGYGFENALAGRKIRDIGRRGKLLVFHLEKDLYLLAHLRMTGQLIYKKGSHYIGGGHSQKALEGDLPNKHTAVSIRFADNSVLYYNDLRKFGYLRIVNAEELSIELLKFGPEPLSSGFDNRYLSDKFKKKRLAVKTALLDQRIVAGIGNIYADETLFSARIKPMRESSSLSKNEISRLIDAIRRIISEAIEQRGTTFSDYRDADGGSGNYSNFLKVYGKGGKACWNCGKTLVKTKVNGRGTVFCPSCQK